MTRLLMVLLLLAACIGCDEARSFCTTSDDCEVSDLDLGRGRGRPACVGGRCTPVDDAGVLVDASSPDSSVPPSDAGADDPCAAISAHADWSLCRAGSGTCEGVFEDGAGCAAFCEAAGLSCSPSRVTPSTATSTTLSLSIGATRETGPSLRACM